MKQLNLDPFGGQEESGQEGKKSVKKLLLFLLGGGVLMIVFALGVLVLTEGNTGRVLYRPKSYLEEFERATKEKIYTVALERQKLYESLSREDVSKIARAIGITENEVRKAILEGRLSREDIDRILSGKATPEEIASIRRDVLGEPVISFPQVVSGISDNELERVASALGVSKERLKELMASGKVTEDTIKRFLNGDVSASEKLVKAVGSSRSADDAIARVFGLSDRELEEAARALGVSKEELMRAIKDGKISVSDLKKAIEENDRGAVERVAGAFGKSGDELLSVVSDEEAERAAKALGVTKEEVIEKLKENPSVRQAVARLLEGKADEEDVKRVAKTFGVGQERTRQLAERSGETKSSPVFVPPSAVASPGVSPQEKVVEDRIVQTRERAKSSPLMPPGSAPSKSPLEVFAPEERQDVGVYGYRRRSDIGMVYYPGAVRTGGAGEATSAKVEKQAKEEPVAEGIALPDGGFFIGSIMDSIVAVEGFNYDLLVVADSDYRTTKGTFPLKDCTVSVKVQANPVSRRIEPVKVNSITCILDNGKFYRAENISGYFADYEDNVRGLKGVLKSADVQKAFLMVMGQLAQAGGQAFALSAMATTTTAFGQTQAVESAGKYLAGTALQATGQAIMEVLKQLGKKYIDYIVVEPYEGKPRKVYFYFTSPVKLYPYGIEQTGEVKEVK